MHPNSAPKTFNPLSYISLPLLLSVLGDSILTKASASDASVTDATDHVASERRLDCGKLRSTRLDVVAQPRGSYLPRTRNGVSGSDRVAFEATAEFEERKNDNYYGYNGINPNDNHNGYNGDGTKSAMLRSCVASTSWEGLKKATKGGKKGNYQPDGNSVWLMKDFCESTPEFQLERNGAEVVAGNEERIRFSMKKFRFAGEREDNRILMETLVGM
jgi:hypothetical protein